MEFQLVKYKTGFNLIRIIVILLICLIILDISFFGIVNKYDTTEINIIPLILAMLIFGFKVFYIIVGYYDKIGYIAIDEKDIKINNNSYFGKVKIYYVGYDGMSKWYYFPFLFIMIFYYPKSGRGIMCDGINKIKIKGSIYYFLSDSKNDYKKLKEVLNDNIELHKWYI